MRSVVHWDGDRFFASIEQAADRRLRNRPLAVGALRRGVVLSASSEARSFGVRPGMPMRRAQKACPSLVVVPSHFELYEQFYHQILGLCEQTTPLVEPVSIGSAFLDLTGTLPLHGKSVHEVVDKLRNTVAGWLHVSFSTGIAGNKTVSRIASRFRKPAGKLEVIAGTEAQFLAPLPLYCLDGITAEVRETLNLAGVRSLGELAVAPLDALQMAIGTKALQWQRRAQGFDEEPVRTPSAIAPRWRESVEFPEECGEERQILAELRSMLERLMTRLRDARLEARSISLLLRYADHAESSQTLLLPQPSDLESDVEGSFPNLLRSSWKRRVRLRSMVLSIGKIYQPSAQLCLFSARQEETSAKRDLAVAVDAMRKKYGLSAISRGLR